MQTKQTQEQEQEQEDTFISFCVKSFGCDFFP